ncbi:NAD(P)-dependent oxidoreductase [Pelagibius sp. 7325]|uniref:NAD-dependent epimerase/dehydratase family protein n=1 Tax=Pelagibius sp. 7325 TaxID=3131994 RepID=UPI0030ECA1CC
MKRLLITGAAGGLGSLARRRLAGLADILRLSDIADLGQAAPHEELVPCELSDFAKVKSLVGGCDGIVHFGGISVENTWEKILPANIAGTYNIYEAARLTGVKRVFFASSNHAIGFYKRETRIDATDPVRPDSLYGVSKCFGEALARYYYDKYRVETAVVRIGSCFPEPKDHRMMATWLSENDLVSLIERVFTAAKLGYVTVFGASDNEEQWWDNRCAGFLGWRPKDSSEPFREKIDATCEKPESDAPVNRYHGGAFAIARLD